MHECFCEGDEVLTDFASHCLFDQYQGCLFRAYPGQYQTLLDTGTGSYRRLLGSAVRPALGTFKEQLTDALREEGVIEDEGKTLSFLRTGYKVRFLQMDSRDDDGHDEISHRASHQSCIVFSLRQPLGGKKSAKMHRMLGKLESV